MKTITKSIPLLSTLSAVLFATFSIQTQAQESTDWFYCVITDDYNDAAYFTEAFAGDYDDLDLYEDKFLEKIMSTYGEEVDGNPYCSFEEDKSILMEALSQDMADNKDFYAKVITVELN